MAAEPEGLCAGQAASTLPDALAPSAGGHSGRRQRMVSGVIARPELDPTSAQDAAVLCPPVATRLACGPGSGLGLPGSDLNCGSGSLCCCGNSSSCELFLKVSGKNNFLSYNSNF